MADDKYVFLNRDLSWLSFNHRVLMEAADPSVPLYSRTFVDLFQSDEFFRGPDAFYICLHQYYKRRRCGMSILKNW
jgi:polyphosphate kinase